MSIDTEVLQKNLSIAVERKMKERRKEIISHVKGLIATGVISADQGEGKYDGEMDGEWERLEEQIQKDWAEDAAEFERSMF